MPWRMLIVVAGIGGVFGAVWGFVRGLDYLPTLPVAILEGAVLFGVPAALLGLILVALWSLVRAVRRSNS